MCESLPKRFIHWLTVRHHIERSSHQEEVSLHGWGVPGRQFQDLSLFDELVGGVDNVLLLPQNLIYLQQLLQVLLRTESDNVSGSSSSMRHTSLPWLQTHRFSDGAVGVSRCCGDNLQWFYRSKERHGLTRWSLRKLKAMFKYVLTCSLHPAGRGHPEAASSGSLWAASRSVGLSAPAPACDVEAWASHRSLGSVRSNRVIVSLTSIFLSRVTKNR